MDDTLEYMRAAGVVPGSLRVNHRYRAPHADPQAIGFGTINTAIVLQAQLFQPLFQVCPRFQADLFFTTLWFGLICADKNMPLYRFYMKICCFLLKFVQQFNPLSFIL
jgi:hypothetical protein